MTDHFIETQVKTILSAPYPGIDKTTFHEWQLNRPSDILAVYLLIRNLDRWTSTTFRELVVKGVNDLANDVVSKQGNYRPWKRVDVIARSVLATSEDSKENISITSSARTTPPKARRSKR